jgi:hypothetical protein
VVTSSTGAAAPAAFRQQASAVPVSGRTVVTTYASAQLAADTNIVIVGWNDATSTITSVTDSAKNAYQVAAPVVRGTGLSQAIYYAPNIKAATAGTNKVTVSFSRTVPYPDVRSLEYVGLDPTSPPDGSASASGTSSSANSGSAATTGTNDLLVGAGTTATVFTAPGTGYTKRVITTPDGDIAEDQIVTAAGTYNATAPLVSGPWVMQLAAFKAASTSGTTTTTTSTTTTSTSTTASTSTSTTTSTSTSTTTTSTSTTTTSTPTTTTTLPAGTVTADWTQRLVDVRHSSSTPDNTTTSANLAGYTQRWRLQVPQCTGAPFAGGGFDSTPVTFKGTIFVGALNGCLLAVNEATGAVIWSRFFAYQPNLTCPQFGIVSSVQVSDNGSGGPLLTFNSPDGYLYKLNGSDGSTIQRSLVQVPSQVNPPGNDVFAWSSPNSANGTDYVGVSSNCDIPFVQGKVIAYDQSTGATVWTHKTIPDGFVGAGVWTDPAIGPDGNVWADTGSVDDSVNSADPNTTDGFEQYSLLKINAADGSLLCKAPAPPSNLAAVTTAYRQQASAVPVSGQTVVTTYASAQLAADTNIVIVGWNDATSTITSVTDSAGNAYQVAAPVVRGTGLSQAIYYAPNIKATGAGTNKVTVSFSRSVPYPDVRSLEYVGLDPASPPDGSASASGSSASANSGSAATTGTNDLLVGAGTTATVFTAPGTGYTKRVITNPDGDIAEDQIVTPAGTFNATAPLVSGPWVMQLAAFKVLPGDPDYASSPIFFSGTVGGVPNTPLVGASSKDGWFRAYRQSDCTLVWTANIGMGVADGRFGPLSGGVWDGTHLFVMGDATTTGGQWTQNPPGVWSETGGTAAAGSIREFDPSTGNLVQVNGHNFELPLPSNPLGPCSLNGSGLLLCSGTDYSYSGKTDNGVFAVDINAAVPALLPTRLRDSGGNLPAFGQLAVEHGHIIQADSDALVLWG